jgi:exopolysaccharide production protein ExoZ
MTQTETPDLSATPEIKPRVQRADGLQWGRAFAAIIVVATHAIAHPLPHPPSLAHLLARSGVTLFFVISGYIMVLTTGADRFNALSFMARRIKRIVPLYYLATAITAVMAFALPNLFKETTFNVEHLIKSLLFIPMYRPGDSGLIVPFFRLGWTLNFEMFFYFIFALTFFLNLKRRVVLLTVLFLSLILIGQTRVFSGAALKYYTQIDTLGFVAGLWVAALREPITRFAHTLMGKVLITITIASIIYMAWLYDTIRENPWTQVWLVAICASAVAGLISIPQRWFDRAPKFISILGDASYAIYLFHMFAIGLVLALTKKFAPELFYKMALISTIAGIGVGVVVYIFIERPIMRAMRRTDR